MRSDAFALLSAASGSSSAIELTLFGVTDTSGVSHTDAPGSAWQTFAQGETVRVTFKATNAGPAIRPWMVVNLWAPDHSRPFQDSLKGELELGTGETRYYSFDWTIPVEALVGSYALSASLRDAADFATLYDTLVAGPGTGWGPGDTLFSQFSVTTDPCADDTAGCDPQATCTARHAVSTCACATGWTGDGFTCADVDECAVENGGCGLTGQCVNTPGSYECFDNGPGVQLTLYAVSDTSGDPHGATPGKLQNAFSPGATARITLRAINTGAAVDPWTVLNVLSPKPAIVFDRSAGPATLLDTGEVQYYSFDWQIPSDARMGGYGIAASLRSEQSFSTLYDTLIPGSRTAWGPGDTIHDAFQVLPGIGLSLVGVTDASGAPDSAAPGVPQAVFSAGSTVRITIGVLNTGPAVAAHPILRLWSPTGSLASKVALASSTFATGQSRRFSFDWVVPSDAVHGGYSVAVSLAGDVSGSADPDAIGAAAGVVTTSFAVAAGVEVVIDSVTDASRQTGSPNPGRPSSVFAPGDTVRIRLRAVNSGPTVAPCPFLNVWSPDSVAVFNWFLEAVPPLPPGVPQYYSYDWVVPWDAQEGSYGVSAAIRSASDFHTVHDTLVPGPNTGWGPGDTQRDAFSIAKGVSLSLYAVTDDSGSAQTSAPGTPSARDAAPTFAPGETVRITFKVVNSGPAVTPRVVLNLWAPGTVGRALDSSQVGNVMQTTEARYFSFDWKIPAQAPLGPYSISASVRSASTFSTLYDTLVPGPNSGWGPGDVAASMFKVAPIARLTIPRAATGVGALSWTAATGGSYRLTVGTRPGATDVLDTGPTGAITRTTDGMPPGPLWAQVWTELNGQWLSSAPVLFTRDSAWSAPRFAAPMAGALAFDPRLPVEWSPASLAYSHRLTVGTTPGASDLVDTGPIQVLRRFLPALPRGTPLYARLESELPDRRDVQEVLFQLSLDATGSTSQIQIENVLWAVGFVRQMAGLDNIPAPYTPLAAEVQKAKQDAALCSQYARALIAVLGQMNVSLPSRLLTIGFNPNFYEMHDLGEVQDVETGRWMVVDPLFGVAPRRAADGAWATAEDVQEATLAQSWSDISYVSLHPLSAAVLHKYYVDYPLLFLNVWHTTDQIVWGSGRSVLPYLVPASLSAASARWLVVQAPAAVTLLADGAERVLTVDGVDRTSRMFSAARVAPSSGDFTLFAVRRSVFALSE